MNDFALRTTDYISSGLKTVFSRSTWNPTSEVITMGDLLKPKGVVFEITNACNSRCKSCNIWQTKIEKNMLSADDILRVFENDIFNEIESFIITGGEPSLRKDLYKIIAGLNKVIPKAEISLSTNGILGNKVFEIVSKLFDEEGISKLTVGVSVDAVGEKHDELRGVKGNFKSVDKLLNDLFLLKKRHKKLNIIVGQTFSPLTVDRVVEVSNYACSKNAHYLPQLYEEFSYYANDDDSSEAVKQSNKIEGAVGHHKSSNVKDSQAYSQDPVKIIKSFPPLFQKEVMLRALKRNRPVMHVGKVLKKNFCASLNTFFLLRANGDVAPCLQHSNYKVGNLKYQLPDDVWVSKSAKEGRKMISQCSGCSNTWATSWTAKYCFVPFIPLIARTFAGKLLEK
jgi:MoaA/NifB/PqqE/SkfB family radical SAM enzyme